MNISPELKITVACVQPSCGQNMDKNIKNVCSLIRDACDDGAQLIALPENVALMDHRTNKVIESATRIEKHPAILEFSRISVEKNIWILAGSVAAISPNKKVVNSSALLNNKGNVVGSYNKIHMFDVNLPNGEKYKESDIFYAGERPVVLDTPWGGIGMSICYDLRFPQLYRALAHQGANIISVPSAFTKVTGREVWHVLNRARAIETSAFVLSPCMWGKHSGGRETYGHSMIVDPWGKIIADAGDGVSFVSAEIDISQVARARAAIPSLRHDKVLS